MPALFLAAAAYLWSGSAVSDPAVVNGHTTATAKSIASIRDLLGINATCSNLQSIFAEDGPEGFDPKSVPTITLALGLAPIEPIRYELWTVGG